MKSRISESTSRCVLEDLRKERSKQLRFSSSEKASDEVLYEGTDSSASSQVRCPPFEPPLLIWRGRLTNGMPFRMALREWIDRRTIPHSAINSTMEDIDIKLRFRDEHIKFHDKLFYERSLHQGCKLCSVTHTTLFELSDQQIVKTCYGDVMTLATMQLYLVCQEDPVPYDACSLKDKERRDADEKRLCQYLNQHNDDVISSFQGTTCFARDHTRTRL